jgi:hypothetical protein
MTVAERGSGTQFGFACTIVRSASRDAGLGFAGGRQAAVLVCVDVLYVAVCCASRVSATLTRQLDVAEQNSRNVR